MNVSGSIGKSGTASAHGSRPKLSKADWILRFHVAVRSRLPTSSQHLSDFHPVHEFADLPPLPSWLTLNLRSRLVSILPHPHDCQKRQPRRGIQGCHASLPHGGIHACSLQGVASCRDEYWLEDYLGRRNFILYMPLCLRAARSLSFFCCCSKSSGWKARRYSSLPYAATRRKTRASAATPRAIQRASDCVREASGCCHVVTPSRTFVVVAAPGRVDVAVPATGSRNG